MPANNDSNLRIYVRNLGKIGDTLCWDVCDSQNRFVYQNMHVLPPFNECRYFGYETRKPITSMLKPGAKVIVASKDANVRFAKKPLCFHIMSAYEISRSDYKKMEEQVQESQKQQIQRHNELSRQYAFLFNKLQIYINQCRTEFEQKINAVPNHITLEDLIKQFALSKQKK
jgi:hypothetical protein